MMQSNRARHEPVTIEQTAKRYKAQIALSFVVFMIGLFMLIASGVGKAGGTAGAAIMMIAATWGVVARLVAWWHHG